MTLLRLLQLIKRILATLIAFHRAGYVHRDVQEDNMVETLCSFCLIDWELAGPNGEFVFWSGKSLPPDVNAKLRPFVHTDDLWQLGKTISRLAFLTPLLCSFAESLLCGGVRSAQAAFAAMQKA